MNYTKEDLLKMRKTARNIEVCAKRIQNDVEFELYVRKAYPRYDGSGMIFLSDLEPVIEHIVDEFITLGDMTILKE